ncbi:hypothetical protein CRUP_036484 [Coryphaenoides rupestris]|nr:hypothetical protein CRUP_036484 [Coryphaenoides rupestris]
MDESLLARAEALAAVDIASQNKSHLHHHPPHHSPFKPDATYHTMNTLPCTSSTSSASSVAHHPPRPRCPPTPPPPHHSPTTNPHQGLEGDLLEPHQPGTVARRHGGSGRPPCPVHAPGAPGAHGRA